MFSHLKHREDTKLSSFIFHIKLYICGLSAGKCVLRNKFWIFFEQLFLCFCSHPRTLYVFSLNLRDFRNHSTIFCSHFSNRIVRCGIVPILTTNKAQFPWCHRKRHSISVAIVFRRALQHRISLFRTKCNQSHYYWEHDGIPLHFRQCAVTVAITTAATADDDL